MLIGIKETASARPDGRGRPRVNFAQWRTEPSGRKIISGLKKGLTEQAIANRLGVCRAAVSAHIRKFSKELGEELGLKIKNRYWSSRLKEKIRAKREERVGLLDQLNSARDLGYLIKNKICPPYFRQLAEACQQVGLNFGLVINQKSFQYYLKNGSKENLRHVVNSFWAKINGWLCQVYFSGRLQSAREGRWTPSWHFLVRKSKIRHCHSVILICGNGEIFTVPAGEFQLGKFRERKLVSICILASQMVKVPGGQGKKRPSRSYWFRFAGFPKERFTENV